MFILYKKVSFWPLFIIQSLRSFRGKMAIFLAATKNSSVLWAMNSMERLKKLKKKIIYVDSFCILEKNELENGNIEFFAIFSFFPEKIKISGAGVGTFS